MIAIPTTFSDAMAMLGTVLSIVGFLPQIIKLYRTRQTEGVSVPMVLNFTVCSIAWVIYGVLEDVRPLWLTNLMGLAFNAIILIQIFLYRRK